jgi:protein-tyrosine phosphatase
MSLYWIDAKEARLGIMPRPRGNDWLADDLRTLRQAGVDVVVSALTTSENEELGLTSEERECTQAGLVFVSFPIEDRSVPTVSAKFDLLIEHLLQCSRKGKAIAVHCRAGIGRSSMIAASMLVKMRMSVNDAFNAIEKARGCAVPDTPEQRRWVECYCVLTRG